MLNSKTNISEFDSHQVTHILALCKNYVRTLLKCPILGFEPNPS